MININNKKGFAILYAVLMTSVILTVSLGLLNITLKQIILSSVVKESQAAYYTALSSFRCALRNDDPYFYDPYTFVSPGPFGEFTSFDPTIVFDSQDGSVLVNCGNGVSQMVTPSNRTGLSSSITTFSLTFPAIGLSPTRCATVTVTKNLLTGNTLYQALGYNTCDTNSPRRIERTVSYETRT